jgi:hypothetical protein
LHILRRHPERSEGPLYFRLSLAVLYSRPPTQNQTSGKQKNLKSLSYFPSPKNTHPTVHVYHTIHHNFTTKNHPLHTAFPKTPLKNTSKSAKIPATTTPNFSRKNLPPNPRNRNRNLLYNLNPKPL